MLSLYIKKDSFNLTSGHECTSCTHVLCEAGCEIFENLEKLESTILITGKIILIILGTASYVYNENNLFEQALLYYEK